MDRKGKNCKEYCRWGKVCTAQGEIEGDPWECGLADRFEDWWMDAEDIRKEQERGSSDWIDEEAESDEGSDSL